MGYNYGIPYPCGPCKGDADKEHNSIFRSEKMALYQLFLQSDAAYAVVAELGELGLVQFKDLNPELSPFQRKFVTEVRVCEEMDRIIRFVESELAHDKIKPAILECLPGAPQPKEIRDLHESLMKLEEELKDINANRRQLKTNHLEMTELQAVLNASHHFLEEHGFAESQAAFSTGFANVNAGYNKELGSHDLEMGEKPQDSSMKLNFITGTIPTDKVNSFERMLWFACRGNVYLRYEDISEQFEDINTEQSVRKSVFCLFFQGEQLKSRAKKICEGFHANIYNLPSTPEERMEMSTGLAQRIADLTTVLEKTEDHRRRQLVSTSHDIRDLSVRVLKAKAIYHHLNMFNMDVTHKCLIAECWCPVRDVDTIKAAINEGTKKCNSDVPSIMNQLVANEQHPTFNRTNKFTTAFQSIVNAYGVSRYLEINPALFSIVTFPFIFAIMFGDLAHGLILFGFGMFMIVREGYYLANKDDNEIWNIIFGGRYIVMLMGAFSVYTGWIYNDFFSKSVNLFGSSWYSGLHMAHDDDILHYDWHYMTLNPRNLTQYTGSPHPFGMDPIWMIASNKITYTNSYKMKMSIIIGVCQMLFGLMLSICNHIYFRKWVNIFCEFIPELLFMLSIFGYMVLLIVVKWLTKFDNTSCAPSILVGFINMFLFSYNDTLKPGCNELILFTDVDTMKSVQTILVGIAGICLPWLLVTKPVVIGIQRAVRKARAPTFEPQVDSPHAERFTDIQLGQGNGENGDHAQPQQSAVAPNDHEKETPMGELIVHQSIHTIEYCLGCVSNTASYLRLWALSLAHAQLSEVLWNMVLKIGPASNAWWGGPVLIPTFAGFAVLTVAVLLMMEGLSAFLHALRLHWVEFNSKFYAADGVKFLPFNFKAASQPRLAPKAT